jgi:hypothetical protein
VLLQLQPALFLLCLLMLLHVVWPLNLSHGQLNGLRRNVNFVSIAQE